MHDVARVGERDRVAYAHELAEQGLPFLGSEFLHLLDAIRVEGRDDFAQRPATHEAHRIEAVRARFVAAVLVDRDDAGVIELTGQAGLAFEASAKLGATVIVWR